jgi:hypothetical protein
LCQSEIHGVFCFKVTSPKGSCEILSSLYVLSASALSLVNFSHFDLGHVKLIIWFSDTAVSAKNRPLACIYHQTKINTTVKKSAFKFLHLLTWIDQRETTPISI